MHILTHSLSLAGKIIDPEEDLTLQGLLDLDAAGHIEQIQEIQVGAEKEYNLERNLNAMKKEWETIEYEVKAYRDTGTFIVGGIDDIITLLDDHLVKTQTMRGSPFIKPIEGITKAWEHKLKYAQVSTYSLTHLLTHLLSHLLTHLLTHLLRLCLMS